MAIFGRYAYTAGVDMLGLLSAARTSTTMLSTLDPVVTAALAALLLFSEALSPMPWADGIAILAAVLWLVKAGSKADETRYQAGGHRGSLIRAVPASWA